jgi:hypothetical protein
VSDLSKRKLSYLAIFLDSLIIGGAIFGMIKLGGLFIPIGVLITIVEAIDIYSAVNFIIESKKREKIAEELLKMYNVFNNKENK